MGESERHLHELFETARRNSPCVLFFDELDALGQKRTNLRMHGPMRNVVNQLLYLTARINEEPTISVCALRPGSTKSRHRNWTIAIASQVLMNTLDFWALLTKRQKPIEDGCIA